MKSLILELDVLDASTKELSDNRLVISEPFKLEPYEGLWIDFNTSDLAGRSNEGLFPINKKIAKKLAKFFKKMAKDL